VARIFWDTNIFIYLLENHALAPVVAALGERIERNGHELLTSYLTLAEIQVKPNRMGDRDRAQSLARAVKASTTLIAFDESSVAAYAAFREKTAAKPPDALQLACAVAAGASIFVTNDRQLLNAAISDFDMLIVTPDSVPI